MAHLQMIFPARNLHVWWISIAMLNNQMVNEPRHPCAVVTLVRSFCRMNNMEMERVTEDALQEYGISALGKLSFYGKIIGKLWENYRENGGLPSGELASLWKITIFKR